MDHNGRTQMKVTQKAIVFGLVTEGVAASFVVIDAQIGLAAYDAISFPPRSQVLLGNARSGEVALRTRAITNRRVF